MEKNKWIDEVLKSSEGMQRVTAGPFFGEKVMQRIESLKEVRVQNLRPGALWALRASLAVMIILNTLCITAYFRQASTAQNTETNERQIYIYTELSSELGLQSNYNY